MFLLLFLMQFHWLLLITALLIVITKHTPDEKKVFHKCVCVCVCPQQCFYMMVQSSISNDSLKICELCLETYKSKFNHILLLCE